MTTPDPIAFLARLPPFNRLSAAELEPIARELKVDCYPAGEVLVKAGETPACLYFIIEGAVYEVDGDPCAPSQGDAVPPGHPALWCVVSLYAAEDAFDAHALLEGASQHHFIVNEPTRCFLLPRPAFLRAVQSHPPLATFYNQKISQRLATLRETGDSRDLSSFTLAKIQDAYIHPPVFIDAGSSIHDAALAMKAHKTNSVLVQDGDELGIVTATDLREAAIIQRRSVDEPVGPLATYELISKHGAGRFPVQRPAADDPLRH